jgi:PHP family Zn ribbon phosphoesterase
LEEFFGEFHEKIRVVETGLSADPEVLGLIPELDDRVLLSNSDAHSSALNRLAREFSVLDVGKLSYDGIIEALREKRIEYTLEFPPTEGRFFFTGHRAGRRKPRPHGKNEFCYFSPDRVPKGNICPICGRELTKGVLHRAFEIGEAQGKKRSLDQSVISQRFVHGVPLIEAVALGLGVKSISSRKVRLIYERIIDAFGNEVNLWREDTLRANEIVSDLSVPENVKNVIYEIKRDNFTFDPPGFDGQYGRLVVGRKTPYLGLEVIRR